MSLSYLLDSNILSAAIKRPRALFHRMQQYAGRLCTSRICVAEIAVWVHLSPQPERRKRLVDGLLAEIAIQEFDEVCTDAFGQLSNKLRQIGAPVPEMDLLIAATAWAYDLTLVTENVKDFERIPGLQVVNWLAT